MLNPRKIREIIGILMLGLVVILLLALVSYKPTDTSANVSSTLERTDNFMGRTGAWLADFIFMMFGMGGFTLVAALLVFSILLIWKKNQPRFFPSFFGVFLLILSVSCLFQFSGLKLVEQVNFMPGGVVGAGLNHFLEHYLNRPGAFVFIIIMLVLGVMLSTTHTMGDLLQRIFRRSGHNKETEWDDKSEKTNSRIPPIYHPLKTTKSDLDKSGIENVAQKKSKQTSITSDIPISKLEIPDRTPAEVVVVKNRSLQAVKKELPPLSLLAMSAGSEKVNEMELMEKAQQIIKKYAEFDIDGSIDAIHPGPVVTLFEFRPAPGVKYSRMVGLVDDLCLGLQAESVRIDRIPGKSTVGVEVPNSWRQTIAIREVLETKEFQQSRSLLTLALGKKINGDVYLTDLAKMPHLLVAGATGQGKSVGLNTMITSILYKATADEVKFIFIDPKRLELGTYADIPHLLTPIVTDAKMAANTLIWAVHEMEERYKLLAKYAVKDIEGFNRLCRESEDTPPIPYIVLVIDELAELLSVASKKVELCLQRLAQMARAVGVHIIMATQRPSVEVVTGVIKANFPSRISFRLLSKYDSKTILDTVGAEHLLGKGDMLFLPPNTAKMIRVHGAFISEEETKAVVDFLKNSGTPQYMELKLLENPDEENGDEMSPMEDDPLYEDVAQFVVKQRRASTSILQRRFRIGYGRAARLMDMMEEDGLVGPADGSRPREVLVPPDYFDRGEG